MRELYVYYRVAPADEAGLASRAAALTAEMHTLDTALQVRWLRRAPPDGSSGAATWMEVWTHPGGIDEAQAARIDAAARRLLGAAALERHVEVFEPLGPLNGGR